jgi:hypothetical protein
MILDGSRVWVWMLEKDWEYKGHCEERSDEAISEIAVPHFVGLALTVHQRC